MDKTLEQERLVLKGLVLRINKMMLRRLMIKTQRSGIASEPVLGRRKLQVLQLLVQALVLMSCPMNWQRS